ncbi:hypothetical protein A3K48_02630 [candidate division WOR-1 bacterium RIFOXYA12_FULL_52_29]|uniref:Polysaccharide chain length determinant N-terminal domain-containing protein n=1 Tax=candidate division WOR-1 bacterium RIFOXYC12_FULL_54_18 TaxID=1802584 RepID=A0A1F4T5R3_UNCSA|nr:MAG: hypothetical protein A3K44_02630 [candidate division WOR-1 bacterium RIFOXYA2_FULL_51_19]OGC17470.1 MAG: hypothetical protein A3K48_02630 [candidate division WOR-1 bacterium RIFOXYA12_FULL_52_29]OGC26328.1 MAG: hypothetical protein A3K32_02625 [candidate division WOR-1 bacterium RIFOXYB2_FULL_45_9]OGC27887.1 MAG: hypothetical protein A3K49_02630 [candidate division WOR-1 bacterium RIFOXYC12_FULL_54_18]OGC29825.1 MAG: hypothetical protein A2346_03705 [candidate division WOR-1 bacterium R
MDEDINLRDYLAVVIKRWPLVLVITVGAMLFFGLPSLSRKDVYEAKVSILLKETTGSGSSATGQLASMLGFKTGSGAAEFPKIMESRSVAEIVFDSLRLDKKITGWDSPEIKKQELIKSLMSMVDISGTDLMEIKVLTEDPILSADIANAMVAAGEQYWKKINYTEARKKKEYIESQLPRIEGELRLAENAIKKFTLLSSDPNELQGVELKRLEREYEIQNSTYVMLRKEYESAKLDESKELTPFSIIDPAERPVKPLKHKIVLNFVIGFVFGAFCSVFLAFFLEYWQNISSSTYKKV